MFYEKNHPDFIKISTAIISRVKIYPIKEQTQSVLFVIYLKLCLNCINTFHFCSLAGK